MAIRVSVLVCFFLLLLSRPGGCQTAIVNHDLVFGDILSGVPKSVTKTTPGSAAEFHISGTAGDEVSIDFTLPTYMNSTGSNMQMVFTKTDCAMDSSESPDQTNPGQNNLNPWHTLTYRLGSNGLTVWLGGTVIPKLVQQSGSYSQLKSLLLRRHH
ncbi:MAG: hypothetical protein NTV06_07310 [candidate division Zixibacteria bacterium]|nr:hypothetical protein [candidate division Zixibacteria bacterium]